MLSSISTKSDKNLQPILSPKTDSPNHEENEDIIIQFSKRQRKMSNYSDEEGIGYSSRELILEWCEKVLDSIVLTQLEKESIFHRFTTAFDFVMEKLFLIHQSIKTDHELKKLVVTIFLLTYKLEGFSIGKITITSLIDAFLKSLGMNNEDLSKDIIETELKILKFIDYNPLILDNNIHQLGFILLDLMKSKFFLGTDFTKEENISKIEKELLEMNRLVQFAEDESFMFDLVVLDKSVISLVSVVSYDCTENWITERIEKFYKYLKEDLKVLKIEDDIFWKYKKEFCEKYRASKGENNEMCFDICN